MKSFIILISLFTIFAHAEDKTFKGESEASALIINGNVNSESYSAKTMNTYAVSEMDLASIFGRYIRSVASGLENAKAWEAGLRYERIFTKDLLSGFVQHKAEHDPYNGIFIQRDSTDIGVKYYFAKNDVLEWVGELGPRIQNTYIDSTLPRDVTVFVRMFTQADYKVSATTSTRLWVEHLANLKNPSQYQTNAELSLAVAMNNIFSLKTAYLFKRDESIVASLKKDSSTWTTALVAKY